MGLVAQPQDSPRAKGLAELANQNTSGSGTVPGFHHHETLANPQKADRGLSLFPAEGNASKFA